MPMPLLHFVDIRERVMKKIVRSYSELIKLKSFEDRFQYLKLDGTVGKDTFGFRRWLNQEFYHSDRWLHFRDEIMIRDGGCDLAMAGYEIYGPITIHHLNPITYEDILLSRSCVFDPENTVCTKLITHNAIHYGNSNLLFSTPIERSPNDTCPWRKI